MWKWYELVEPGGKGGRLRISLMVSTDFTAS